MYCAHCGQQIDDRSVVCSACGQPVNTATYQDQQGANQQPYGQPQGGWNQSVNQGYEGYQGYQPMPNPADQVSVGFNILGFFIPIVGLILYLCMKNETPIKAKAIGKWTLIGFIVSLIFNTFTMVILPILLASVY